MSSFDTSLFKLTRDTARPGTRLSDQLEHSRGDWLEGSSLPDCKMSLNAAFCYKTFGQDQRVLTRIPGPIASNHVFKVSYLSTWLGTHDEDANQCALGS